MPIGRVSKHGSVPDRAQRALEAGEVGRDARSVAGGCRWWAVWRPKQGLMVGRGQSSTDTLNAEDVADSCPRARDHGEAGHMGAFWQSPAWLEITNVTASVTQSPEESLGSARRQRVGRLREIDRDREGEIQRERERGRLRETEGDGERDGEGDRAAERGEREGERGEIGREVRQRTEREGGRETYRHFPSVPARHHWA